MNKPKKYDGGCLFLLKKLSNAVCYLTLNDPHQFLAVR